MRFIPVWLLTILSATAQVSSAQSGTTSVPEVNLGPPTVSTPATLTPVGYLQFKNGALSAEHSSEFSRRFGISQVTKLSVFPRHEVSECPRDGTRDPGSRRRAPRPEIAPYTERITGKSKVIKTNENGLSVEVRDFPVAQYFRTCLRVKAQHPALQWVCYWLSA